jgi:WD40 repeat protein
LCYPTTQAVRIKSSLIGSNCVAMAHMLGSCLITAHFDKSVHLRDARVDLKESTSEIETEHTEQITGILSHPNGTKLLTYSKDHTLKEWDVRAQAIVCTYTAPEFQVGVGGCHATYSPDGTYLASGAGDGSIFVWDVATTKLVKRLPPLQGGAAVLACEWKAAGDELGSVAKDGKITFWAA